MTLHATITLLAALHYYESREPFYLTESNGQPRQGTGDHKHQATRDLVNAGLLRETQGRNGVEFTLTDGLKVYVDSLRRVPFPVQTWQAPK